MDFIESFKMSLFKRQFILFELLQVYDIAFRWNFLLVFCYNLSFKIQSESLFQLEIIKAQCLWSVYLYLLNLLSIHNVDGIVRKSAWQKYGESVLLENRTCLLKFYIFFYRQWAEGFHMVLTYISTLENLRKAGVGKSLNQSFLFI